LKKIKASFFSRVISPGKLPSMSKTRFYFK